MNETETDRPRLLDALNAGPIGVSSPDDMAKARAQMLPWLEEQVVRLPQQTLDAAKRGRVRVMALSSAGLLLAAAAAVAFTVSSGAGSELVPALHSSAIDSSAAMKKSSPDATVISGRLTTEAGLLNAGQEVSSLAHVETAEEQVAAFRAHSGYLVELGPSSSLRLLEEERSDSENGGVTGHSESIVLRLERGLARFSVLPRPKGSSFRVVAGDVTVRVVGTAFSVEVLENARICVRVMEGSVQLERGSKIDALGAGESLGCDDGSQASFPGLVPAPLSVKKVQSRSLAPQVQSTLAEENAVLAGALSAEKRGDKVQARQLFQQLLSRYPKSAFSPDARAGLQRVSARGE